MVVVTWLLLIAGLIITIIYLHKQNKKRKNLPPGPWNLPIFGYLPWLDPKAPHVTLTKLSQKYGSIYGLHLGSIYTVVISDVNLLKQIFYKDAGSGRAPLHIIDSVIKGKGIIFVQGDLWKDQRKFIHNFLRAVGASKTSQNRDKMESVMTDNMLELVQFIKGKGDPAVLAPAEILFHTVGSLITVITLGKSWSRDDETWKYLVRVIDEGSKLLGVAAPSNFLPFLSIFPKYKNVIRFLNDQYERTCTIYKKIIREEQWKSGDDQYISNLIEAFMIEKSKREGIADTDKIYNEDQLHHLMSDMFGAGLETTTNSILWFLLYMTVYQEIQNKVREELEEVLHGNLPTLDDLSKLPYTEATIAEVLRIRSLLPLGVPHGAVADIRLEGFTIMKGTMILPLMWAIHMDPKVWGDPENFRPERFLDNEGKFYQPDSFIPFQIGKRMCVGMELAKMQLFLFVSIILQKFRIECEDRGQIDLTGIYGLTLTPKVHKLVFSEIKGC